jgi:phosphoribosylformylglycinamidine synthase
MRYAVHVELSKLDGIADPEGRTIERALPALGFSGVGGVHVAKVVRFDLDAVDEATARAVVEQMCVNLLANPVIERYEVQLQPSGASGGAGEASSGLSASGAHEQ